jgi:hypothetical protein
MDYPHADDDPIVRGKNSTETMIRFAAEAKAFSEEGKAIAFGQRATACSTGDWGHAVCFGSEGIATATTAIAIEGSHAMATSRRLAIALSYTGTAVSDQVAIATNVLGKAHGKSFAVCCGKGGIADGLIAISLGPDGQAVAREGGTIALAFYDQHPGRWESAHGCDPTWFDGDDFLSDLRVAKVGENGIRPNFIYRLDRIGKFVEVGPATDQLTYEKTPKAI